MCRKPAHYKIFREKIPFTITRTLIPKSPRVHGKFHGIFSIPAFLFLLNHSNTQVFCALKNFLSVYSAIRTKPVTISKIFPLTFLRTLIPKIQPLRIKFFILLWNLLFLSLPQGQKVCKGGGLEENFSEKIKKDRDRRQKCGRSLARSLPDSHGQPGYFAVFLNSHPAQLSAPGYFRASYSHSQ